MNDHQLQPSRFVVHKNHSIISLIERWPDQNYAPRALDCFSITTSTTFEVIGRLHGCSADNAHVDLAHSNVILLIAESAGDSQEYYAEVPIPAGINPTIAYVEIGPDFVTVRLDRSHVPAVRWIKAQVARLKNDLALLSGRGRQIHRFDDRSAV